MAEKKEKTEQSAVTVPDIIEGNSREEVVQAVKDVCAGNPGVEGGIVQFDASREKPFWVVLTNKK